MAMQVWVVPELREDGHIYWRADSDSQLTKVRCHSGAGGSVAGAAASNTRNNTAVGAAAAPMLCERTRSHCRES